LVKTQFAYFVCLSTRLLRDNVQAKLRVMVKHILKKYGYPPDKQQKATDTVLDQAKLLCKDWAETQN
jgi:type I restriction enzyme R subunit